MTRRLILATGALLAGIGLLGGGIVPPGASLPSAFTLILADGTQNAETLPREYTCDGDGVSPPLEWSGAPADTVEFALLMTTLPGDGTIKWNWVVYGIPAEATTLARASTGVGICGAGSHGASLAYDPPCSQGPGPKEYTFTLYALSAPPILPSEPSQVTGDVLERAMSSITLAKAALSLSYSRP